MAYLYQRIMDVPGLSGNSGTRQKQLYEKLGSPQGGYSGSYNQNIWLLDQINKGNYGAQAAAPAAASNPNQTSSGQALIPGTNIPVPNARTPFEQVLPFDKIFDPGTINQLAQEQLSPDVNRAQTISMNDLGRQMASSGAWRTGHAPVARQRVSDQYSRMLKEQTGEFTGQVRNWMTDWYNRQSENYYKNPAAWKMPTLPTWDQYMQQNPNAGVIASAYD